MKSNQIIYIVKSYVVVGFQMSAVRLFFTPEEGDDPQNQAKRHFLKTGECRSIFYTILKNVV